MSASLGPVRAVWVALVAVTLVSWALAGDRRPGEDDLLVTAIVALGFLKAWAVGRWFMELHHARAAVRRAFEAWVVGSFVVVAVAQHLG